MVLKSQGLSHLDLNSGDDTDLEASIITGNRLAIKHLNAHSSKLMKMEENVQHNVIPICMFV